MAKIDYISLVGRILLSGYFIANSIWAINNLSYRIQFFDSDMWVYITAALEFLAALALLIGLKPRVAAGVLGFILILQTVVIHLNFQTNQSHQDKVFEQVVNVVQKEKALHFIAALEFELLLTRIAVIGACMFVAAARCIPFGVMIRSEKSMIQKYGK